MYSSKIVDFKPIYNPFKQLRQMKGIKHAQSFKHTT